MLLTCKQSTRMSAGFLVSEAMETEVLGIKVKCKTITLESDASLKGQEQNSPE